MQVKNGLLPFQVWEKCLELYQFFFQNLREAILQYRNNILRQADEKKRQAALTNFVEYLERYYFLICFSVYLATDPTALQPRGKASDLGFRKWMKDRPELYSILRRWNFFRLVNLTWRYNGWDVPSFYQFRLLRRDPMGALSYKSPLPETTRRASIEKAKSLNKADMEQVLAARTGEVLGKQVNFTGPLSSTALWTPFSFQDPDFNFFPLPLRLAWRVITALAANPPVSQNLLREHQTLGKFQDFPFSV